MSEPPAAVGLSASLQGLGRWVGRALTPGTASLPRGDGWTLWHAACEGHAASAQALVHRVKHRQPG